MKICRTDKEIHDLMENVITNMNNNISKFFNESYESGIINFYEWLTDESYKPDDIY